MSVQLWVGSPCPQRVPKGLSCPHMGAGLGVQGLGGGWVWPCSVRGRSALPLCPLPQKHPDFPKKPLTPYFRFFMEKRAKYAKLHPEMSNLDLTKILSKKYKELPEKKKVRRGGGRGAARLPWRAGASSSPSKTSRAQLLPGQGGAPGCLLSPARPVRRPYWSQSGSQSCAGCLSVCPHRTRRCRGEPHAGLIIFQPHGHGGSEPGCPRSPPPGLGLSPAAEKSPRCPLTHGWCPSGAARGMEAGDWGGNPEL